MRIYCYRSIMVCSYLYTILVFYAQSYLNISVPYVFLAASIAFILLLIFVLYRYQGFRLHLPDVSVLRARYRVMMLGLTVFIAIMYICHTQNIKGASVNGVIGVLVYLTSTVLMLESVPVEKRRSGVKEFYRIQQTKHLLFYAACLFLYLLHIPQFMITCAAQAFHMGASALSRLFPNSEQIMNLNIHMEDLSNKIAEELMKVQKAKEDMYDVHEDDRGFVNKKVKAEQLYKFSRDEVRRAFFILGVVVVIIAAIIIVTAMLTRVKKTIALEDFSEEREKIDDPVKKPVKLHRFIKDDELKVRYYYLLFLKRCKKRKIPLTSSDTTLQIQKKYLNDQIENEECMQQLTDIYRKNRYDERHKSSKQELNLVKELERKL